MYLSHPVSFPFALFISLGILKSNSSDFHIISEASNYNTVYYYMYIHTALV